VQNLDFDESWRIMRDLLPEDLEGVARETGMVRRLRGFSDVEALVRLLMMHGSGLSLEQTALRAAEHGLAKTTAVALHGRLKCSGKFFERLCTLMQEKLREHLGPCRWPEGWKFRAVDATEVREPGPTGSTWRVHYSLRLPDLVCDHFVVSDASRGESLKHWNIAADEVILADRGYSHREAIAGLLEGGGHFVVRLNSGLFPLEDAKGRAVNLPQQLRALKVGKAKSWKLFFRSGQNRYAVRLCAVKKSPQASEISRQKARRRSQRDGAAIQADTLLLADYVLVLTNLDPDPWDDRKVLELYRCRWQVELAFKRLKSLLHLGHLPKRDPSTAKAWMHLKLLLALLIEKLHLQSELFFPWGYELRAD
jgi:hypothetical protein